MMRVVRYDSPEAKSRFEEIRARAGSSAEAVRASVKTILDDISSGGWGAVCAWSERLDGAAPRRVSRDELAAAVSDCGAELVRALERAARNIRDYQTRLMPRAEMWDNPDGGRVGQLIRGLGCVGMYVPGGTAAYPSTVLMNAIPAKVAGVERLVMVTPPTAHMKKEVLAAAAVAGVDEVWAVGGVQAVAALAYGCGDMPKADKIVGPGNAYVAEAKRQLFGHIDIDMIAGPSEILVIADHAANPEWVAADLLSQAEHDRLAGVTLVSTSAELLEAVNQSMKAQLQSLPRRDIAEAALRDYGVAVLCDNLAQAAAVANEIAPEHLELLVKDAGAVLPGILNAGAIFVGPYSPEPVGDYIAGPSHVLPTSGTARFFSPLSVDSFLKKTSVIEYCREALEKSGAEIIALAGREGLEAHANAVRLRVGL